VKKTFEDFLMKKHAEQYIGTKDCMIDDFGDWLSNLSPDEFIEYADWFAKNSFSKGQIDGIEKGQKAFKDVMGKFKI